MDDRDLGQRVIQRRDQTFNFFAVLAAFTLDLGRQLGAIALGDSVNFNNVANFQVRQLRNAILEPGVRIGGKRDVSSIGGDGEIWSADGFHAAVNIIHFAVIVVFIAFIARGRRSG